MVKTNQNLTALFDAFRDEFMQPEIENGMFAEVTTYGVGDLVPLPYLDEDMRPNVTDLHVGYFARLSAPGYMDSTDWAGPFAHEIEAIDHLIDTYADGMGEDEEEVECARCCMIWPAGDTGIDSDGDPICIDCANRHDVAF